MNPRIAADKRAEVLLREHLSAPQLRDYGRCKAFNVQGTNDTLYRIKWGMAFNVTDEDGMSYCAMPYYRRCQPGTGLLRYLDDLPVCDSMLAQKLLIESNTGEFLLLANHGRGDQDIPWVYPEWYDDAASAMRARVLEEAAAKAVKSSGYPSRFGTTMRHLADIRDGRCA